MHKPYGFFGLSCHYFSDIVCNLFIIVSLQDEEIKKRIKNTLKNVKLCINKFFGHWISLKQKKSIASGNTGILGETEEEVRLP